MTEREVFGLATVPLIQRSERSGTGEYSNPERFSPILRLGQRLFQTRRAVLALRSPAQVWWLSEEDADPQPLYTLIDEHLEGLEAPFLSGPKLYAHGLDSDAHRYLAECCALPRLGFVAGSLLHNSDGSLIGSLCFLDDRTRETDRTDESSIRDLAELVESEIQRCVIDSVQADLIGQIKSEQLKSMRDPMTRVLNREGVYTAIHEQFADATQANGSVVILIADLDRFKTINDTAGDAVLMEAVGRMSNVLRDFDVIGRIGGEEFLIALGGDCTYPQAIQIAERLRESCAEQAFLIDGQTLDVTVSIGVACAEHGTFSDIDAVVREADTALYQAKRGGRNRVVTSVAYPPLPQCAS